MPAKRGEGIPRPGSYELKAADRQAGEDWATMERQVPGPLVQAFDAITTKPREVSKDQYRLKDRLANVNVGGKVLEHWQYKVVGSSRLWYAIDDDNRILWLTSAGMAHPKATDTQRRRKRG